MNTKLIVIRGISKNPVYTEKESITIERILNNHALEHNVDTAYIKVLLNRIKEKEKSKNGYCKAIMKLTIVSSFNRVMLDISKDAAFIGWYLCTANAVYTLNEEKFKIQG